MEENFNEEYVTLSIENYGKLLKSDVVLNLIARCRKTNKKFATDYILDAWEGKENS